MKCYRRKPAYIRQVELNNIKFFEKIGEKKPKLVTEDDINYFFSDRKGTSAYLFIVYAHIKGFLDFCGVVLNRRRIKLRLLDDGGENVHWLEDAEKLFLLTCDLTPKERLIVHLGLELACRSIGIRNMKISSFSNGWIRYKSKRDKIHVKPFTSKTQRYLDDWLQERDKFIEKMQDLHPGVEDPGYLFITFYKGKLRQVGPTYIWEFHSKLREKVGIPHLSSHTLRRTWGRDARRRGKDTHKIKRMYGHRRIQTTEDYIRADDIELQNLIYELDIENEQLLSESGKRMGDKKHAKNSQ